MHRPSAIATAPTPAEPSLRVLESYRRFERVERVLGVLLLLILLGRAFAMLTSGVAGSPPTQLFYLALPLVALCGVVLRLRMGYFASILLAATRLAASAQTLALAGPSVLGSFEFVPNLVLSMAVWGLAWYAATAWRGYVMLRPSRDPA